MNSDPTLEYLIQGDAHHLVHNRNILSFIPTTTTISSTTSITSVTPITTTNKSAALSQMAIISEDAKQEAKFFPKGKFDVTGQQLDLRPKNSWTQLLEEIATGEAVEVFAINTLSPF